MKKTIIFDFDGTLADTFPLIVDVTCQITGLSPLTLEKQQELRRLPVLKAMTKLGLSRWALFTQGWKIRPRMHARMHEAPVFEGVPEMLAALHEVGHRLFVLTSNRERNVRAFLQAHKLAQYFEDVAGVTYGNTFFKKKGLRRLLRKLQLEKETCVYVGNEVLDVEAARQVGLQTIAVTWSGHDRSELIATKPDAVVDKPVEIIEAAGK